MQSLGGGGPVCWIKSRELAFSFGRTALGPALMSEQDGFESTSNFASQEDLPPVPKILQQSPDLLVQLQPVPTSPATPDAFNLLCWGIRGGLGDGAPPKHAFALQHRRALYRPSAGKLDISRVLWSAESRLSPSMFSIGLGGGAVGLVALASTGGCPDRPTLFPSSVVLMRFDIPTAFQVSPSLSAGPRPGPLLRAPGRPAGPRRFGPASALSVTAILSSHIAPASALSLASPLAGSVSAAGRIVLWGGTPPARSTSGLQEGLAIYPTGSLRFMAPGAERGPDLLSIVPDSAGNPVAVTYATANRMRMVPLAQGGPGGSVSYQSVEPAPEAGSDDMASGPAAGRFISIIPVTVRDDPTTAGDDSPPPVLSMGLTVTGRLHLVGPCHFADGSTTALLGPWAAPGPAHRRVGRPLQAGLIWLASDRLGLLHYRASACSVGRPATGLGGDALAGTPAPAAVDPESTPSSSPPFPRRLVYVLTDTGLLILWRLVLNADDSRPDDDLLVELRPVGALCVGDLLATPAAPVSLALRLTPVEQLADQGCGSAALRTEAAGSGASPRLAVWRSDMGACGPGLPHGLVLHFGLSLPRVAGGANAHVAEGGSAEAPLGDMDLAAWVEFTFRLPDSSPKPMSITGFSLQDLTSALLTGHGVLHGVSPGDHRPRLLHALARLPASLLTSYLASPLVANSPAREADSPAAAGIPPLVRSVLLSIHASLVKLLPRQRQDSPGLNTQDAGALDLDVYRCAAPVLDLLPTGPPLPSAGGTAAGARSPAGGLALGGDDAGDTEVDILSGALGRAGAKRPGAGDSSDEQSLSKYDDLFGGPSFAEEPALGIAEDLPTGGEVRETRGMSFFANATGEPEFEHLKQLYYWLDDQALLPTLSVLLGLSDVEIGHLRGLTRLFLSMPDSLGDSASIRFLSAAVRLGDPVDTGFYDRYGDESIVDAAPGGATGSGTDPRAGQLTYADLSWAVHAPAEVHPLMLRSCAQMLLDWRVRQRQRAAAAAGTTAPAPSPDAETLDSFRWTTERLCAIGAPLWYGLDPCVEAGAGHGAAAEPPPLSPSFADLLDACCKGAYLRRRDPWDCMLLYLALGRQAAILGLWRVAAGSGRADAQRLVGLLSRDFGSDPRAAKAAQLNAYDLLAKRRPHHAAALFILGGDAPGAVRVLRRHVGLMEAALVARALDHTTGHRTTQPGPQLRALLQAEALLLQGEWYRVARPSPAAAGGRATSWRRPDACSAPVAFPLLSNSRGLGGRAAGAAPALEGQCWCAPAGPAPNAGSLADGGLVSPCMLTDGDASAAADPWAFHLCHWFLGHRDLAVRCLFQLDPAQHQVTPGSEDVPETLLGPGSADPMHTVSLMEWLRLLSRYRGARSASGPGPTPGTELLSYPHQESLMLTAASHLLQVALPESGRLGGTSVQILPAGDSLVGVFAVLRIISRVLRSIRAYAADVSEAVAAVREAAAAAAAAAASMPPRAAAAAVSAAVALESLGLGLADGTSAAAPSARKSAFDSFTFSDASSSSESEADEAADMSDMFRPAPAPAPVRSAFDSFSFGSDSEEEPAAPAPAPVRTAFDNFSFGSDSDEESASPAEAPSFSFKPAPAPASAPAPAARSIFDSFDFGGESDAEQPADAGAEPPAAGTTADTSPVSFNFARPAASAPAARSIFDDFGAGGPPGPGSFDFEAAPVIQKRRTLFDSFFADGPTAPASAGTDGADAGGPDAGGPESPEHTPASLLVARHSPHLLLSLHAVSLSLAEHALLGALPVAVMTRRFSELLEAARRFVNDAGGLTAPRVAPQPGGDPRAGISEIQLVEVDRQALQLVDSLTCLALSWSDSSAMAPQPDLPPGGPDTGVPLERLFSRQPPNSPALLTAGRRDTTPEIQLLRMSHRSQRWASACLALLAQVVPHKTASRPSAGQRLELSPVTLPETSSLLDATFALAESLPFESPIPKAILVHVATARALAVVTSSLQQIATGSGAVDWDSLLWCMDVLSNPDARPRPLPIPMSNLRLLEAPDFDAGQPLSQAEQHLANLPAEFVTEEDVRLADMWRQMRRQKAQDEHAEKLRTMMSAFVAVLRALAKSPESALSIRSANRLDSVTAAASCHRDAIEAIADRLQFMLVCNDDAAASPAFPLKDLGVNAFRSVELANRITRKHLASDSDPLRRLIPSPDDIAQAVAISDHPIRSFAVSSEVGSRRVVLCSGDHLFEFNLPGPSTVPKIPGLVLAAATGGQFSPSFGIRQMIYENTHVSSDPASGQALFRKRQHRTSATSPGSSSTSASSTGGGDSSVSASSIGSFFSRIRTKHIRPRSFVKLTCVSAFVGLLYIVSLGRRVRVQSEKSPSRSSSNLLLDAPEPVAPSAGASPASARPQRYSLQAPPVSISTYDPLIRPKCASDIIASHPELPYYITADPDRPQLLLWQFRRPGPMLTFALPPHLDEAHFGQLTCARFDSTGSRVAAGTSAGHVAVWAFTAPDAGASLVAEDDRLHELLSGQAVVFPTNILLGAHRNGSPVEDLIFFDSVGRLATAGSAPPKGDAGSSLALSVAAAATSIGGSAGSGGMSFASGGPGGGLAGHPSGHSASASSPAAGGHQSGRGGPGAARGPDAPGSSGTPSGAPGPAGGHHSSHSVGLGAGILPGSGSGLSFGNAESSHPAGGYVALWDLLLPTEQALVASVYLPGLPGGCTAINLLPHPVTNQLMLVAGGRRGHLAVALLNELTSKAAATAATVAALTTPSLSGASGSGGGSLGSAGSLAGVGPLAGQNSNEVGTGEAIPPARPCPAVVVPLSATASNAPITHPGSSLTGSHSMSNLSHFGHSGSHSVSGSSLAGGSLSTGGHASLPPSPSGNLQHSSSATLGRSGSSALGGFSSSSSPTESGFPIRSIGSSLHSDQIWTVSSDSTLRSWCPVRICCTSIVASPRADALQHTGPISYVDNTGSEISGPLAFSPTFLAPGPRVPHSSNSLASSSFSMRSVFNQLFRNQDPRAEAPANLWIEASVSSPVAGRGGVRPPGGAANARGPAGARRSAGGPPHTEAILTAGCDGVLRWVTGVF
ncbi:hypothetical protein H696_00789 [Fonticula alba]|uniref:RAVE complex protein Rav1 C-terminal domain-containing protein n=1 Tax=Fonticula alba TaxID=691883 RepID=A0A058ZH34_FONAL|nr:hypothetical protein H696_00789 [Fonticula alba]KCV73248.1 hypothetical protein H696_00789 [Fonticula alba]|eukprot:XP_009492949.1 hypothetical protein H696_00789 [Fonticula alba]